MLPASRFPLLSRRQRPCCGGIANQETEEAQREHGVIEGSAEVLPERSMPTRIIGRKQQTQQVEKPEAAGKANANTNQQRQANRQFTVSDQKRNGCRVRKNKTAQ